MITTFAIVQRNRIQWRREPQRIADAVDLISISSPILLTFGISTIVSRMDMFFLAFRSNPVQVGLYGAALTIATIPEI